MASATADRGVPVLDCALEDLYKQLREIELSDQRLARQIRDLGHYRVMMRSRGSEDDNFIVTGLSREFLDAQHATLSACQTLHDKFREVLRKDINIRSRPSLRPLTILDMPDEILVQVFEYVKGWTPDARYYTFLYFQGVGEIKNLRLTCWRFCNASSHLLLPLVRVELNTASVAHLDTISKHPTISKGVRAVRVVLDYYDYELANNIWLFAEYSADNLGRRTDFSERLALRKTPGSLESDLEPIRKARELENSWTSFASDTVGDATLTANLRGLQLLQRAHEEYQSRAADQKKLLGNQDFVRSVATAISRMPLATRLEFAEFDCQGGRYKRTGSFREGDDEYFMWQILLPMTWDLGRKWGLGTPHGHVLVDLPIAVHETGSVLKGLDLEISSLPESHEVLTIAETRKLSTAVQQVKNMHIRMQDYHLAESESAHTPAYLEYCHQYIHALSNTDSIERIFLDLGCFSAEDMRPLTDLGSLMTFRLWENLVDVSWRSVALYQTDLNRFFQLLQKPLQYLHLGSVRLLSGSWSETLEILHSAPTGYHVTLSDPLGAECEDLGKEEKARIFDKPKDDLWATSEAEDYIMGFSSPNPLKADELNQSGMT